MESATQFRCCDCERDFINETALSQHLRCSKHQRRLLAIEKEKEKEKRELYCKTCDRVFGTPKALQDHNDSIRHHPLCNIDCVASSKCHKSFKCPSALLHHLESGACRSGMTKSKLDAAIANTDTKRIITTVTPISLRLQDSSEYGAASETSSSSVGSPLLTPTSTEFLGSYPASGALTPLHSFPPTDLATMNAASTLISALQTSGKSGGLRRCPLRPKHRTRTFNPKALLQHLTSSVHVQTMMMPTFQKPANEIMFHCPVSLMGNSNAGTDHKQFPAASRLAQHIESGACHGGKQMIRRAIEHLQKELYALGLGNGLRLLNSR